MAYSTTGNGLLPLLMNVQSTFSSNYTDYLWKIEISKKHVIDFLHSGREKDNNYSANLENFDWSDFFSKHKGGLYLENLRSEWKKDYDIVLIDSRTGLSDSSGICTIFLPDVIVPMFTANYQSLYGMRDIVRLAQSARQKLTSRRMPLTIFPVPARFGTRAEFKESQEWLNRFDNDLKEFYTDWLPKWISPKKVLERIKIPQIDYFSFGEKLAVTEQSTNDPESMGYVYSKIASLLASDFSDIESLMGEQYNVQKENHVQEIKVKQKARTTQSRSYEYDVYISYAHSSLTGEWLNNTFLPIFRECLKNEMAFDPKIFMDTTEIDFGISFNDSVSRAVKSSKILIPVVNPKYLRSSFALSELVSFLERQEQTETSIIFPIRISNSEILQNSLLNEFLYWDFTNYYMIGDAFKNSVQYHEMWQMIQRFIKYIIKAIEQAPPFTEEWLSTNDVSIQKRVSEIIGNNSDNNSILRL